MKGSGRQLLSTVDRLEGRSSGRVGSSRVTFYYTTLCLLPVWQGVCSVYGPQAPLPLDNLRQIESQTQETLIQAPALAREDRLPSRQRKRDGGCAVERRETKDAVSSLQDSGCQSSLEECGGSKSHMKRLRGKPSTQAQDRITRERSFFFTYYFLVVPTQDVGLYINAKPILWRAEVTLVMIRDSVSSIFIHVHAFLLCYL